MSNYVIIKVAKDFLDSNPRLSSALQDAAIVGSATAGGAAIFGPAGIPIGGAIGSYAAYRRRRRHN